MESFEMTPAEWWKNQRTNYVYVAMAAGILCFLAYVSIWETFYGTQSKGAAATSILGGIVFRMLQHLILWVPFLFAEIFAFRLLPKLDQRFNPTGNVDARKQILVIGCVAACFLPLVLPTILVLWHG
jgi:hypothetical protein